MSANRSFVDAIFRAWSLFYDNPVQQKLYFGPIQDAVLKRLDYQTSTILDLGCGTGLGMVKLHERQPNTQVYGLDLSHEMLLKASDKPGLSGRLVVADGHRLPIEDDTFDVVICLISFQYYLEPNKALAEMRRVLKPGGRLLLAALTSVFFEASYLDTRFKSMTDNLFRVYAPSELRARLLNAGFSTVDHSLIRPFTRIFEAKN